MHTFNLKIFGNVIFKQYVWKIAFSTAFIQSTTNAKVFWYFEFAKYDQ